MNWRKPLIFSGLYLTRSKIPRCLMEIRRLERLSKERIKEDQQKKLKKLLLHSYENISYYHRILGEVGVVKNNVVDLSKFYKIPILTKKIIRKQGSNLYSKDHKKRGSYENSSGGSTGEPVRFIQDKYYDEWNTANKLNYKLQVNQEPGDKELRLWGSDRDILEGNEKLFIRLRNIIYNRKELNSFKMSEKNMFDFVKSWNKYEPNWVEAYAQSIYEFARYIKRNNLKILSPKGILTSAGNLYPEMKELIKTVFNCPVFNRYGTREVGGVACSCLDDKGLHVSMWSHYLEILDKNLNSVKSNEFGKIYLTTLNNYSMPLIRYDVGDIGVYSDDKCNCGRNNELIKNIEGREMSVFKTKDGKVIPAEFFIHFIGVVYNEEFISKFQVIQKDYDKVLIKIVLNDIKKFNTKKDKIIDSIKKVMGKNCEIEFDFVDDIKATRSGKYLYTKSEVME